MNITVSGTVVRLQGDWTATKITRATICAVINVLQDRELGTARRVSIDCRQVSAIDSVGQALLSGWIQIAGIHGLEPELVNIPIHMRHYFKSTEFGYYSLDSSPNTAG